MQSHPPTQGNDRPTIAHLRLTNLVAWCVLVLAAPLLVLQSTPLMPIALADTAAKKRVEHTFRFDASQLSPPPTTLVVAGSFNGWSKDANPMKNVGGNRWEATVALSEGVTFYKFVADHEKWMPDPGGDRELSEPDGYGGTNSAVLIGPDWRKLPPVPPNAIDADGVFFDPNDPGDVQVADATQARFHLRVRTGDAQKVVLHIQDATGTRNVDMQPLEAARGWQAYAAIARAAGDNIGYWFSLVDGDGVLALDSAGRHGLKISEPASLKPAAFELAMTPAFTTPDWARNAIWYQIFPERFRNGDKLNDPGDKWYERLTKWNSDWFVSLPGEAPGMENFYKGAGNIWKRRYGGDIKGVQDSLPYLRSIGVTAIYFNPIFEAESMHKYDTADYRHVDDNFGVRDEPKEQVVGAPERPEKAYIRIGSEKLYELDGTPVSPDYRETDDPKTWKWTKSDLLFLSFLAEARRQGFRVIVDGVFNHVGRAHPFFQDVLANGKNSKYADWFEINDWGDPANWNPMDDPYAVHGKAGGIQWKAWDEPNGHLPAFKKDPAKGLAAGPYRHIMDITRRWLAPGGDASKGIDGWRLDVPGDIPHVFWIDWRKVVKSTKPDAYISGEVWQWAQDWLEGDQFDAVMNYRFAEAVQDFFVDQKTAIKPSEFDKRLAQIVFNYPLQVALVQQNLFDSHDTDRFASMFVNPDRAYDAQNREQDNAAEVGYDRRRPTDEEWKRNLQAVAFQMTFLGAPMIYYGNEAGMYGPDDPSNRMPMWWKDAGAFDNADYKFDPQVFDFYQRCAAIRNKFEALRTGAFRPVIVDDVRGVYGFAREGASETVYVLMNRSGSKVSVEVAVPEAAKLINYASPDAATVTPDDAKPDARPRIQPVKGATPLPVKSGKVTVELAPYATAILAP